MLLKAGLSTTQPIVTYLYIDVTWALQNGGTKPWQSNCQSSRRNVQVNLVISEVLANELESDGWQLTTMFAVDQARARECLCVQIRLLWSRTVWCWQQRPSGRRLTPWRGGLLAFLAPHLALSGMADIPIYLPVSSPQTPARLLIAELADGVPCLS